MYKQKFIFIISIDEFLFIISFVSIKLYNKSNIIQHNSLVCFTRYFKRIKFIFEKESDDLIKN